MVNALDNDLDARPPSGVGEAEALRDAQRSKEKEDLLASLAGGDYAAQKTRVAAILNLYPDARNSDIALALRYWEMFQPDLYGGGTIRAADLFKLERIHYIVRARAKIQNEYGLFQADEQVRGRRRKHEESVRDAVLADAAPRRIIHVYSDETGKTQAFITVASVWVLTGRAVYAVSAAIESWRKSSAWSGREVHFSKLGRSDLSSLTEYLEVVSANSEYLGFKAITIERSRTRRSVVEIIEKLHELMLIKGAEHDVGAARFELPREVEVTIDEEQSLDPIALAELKGRVADRYASVFDNGLKIVKLNSVSSRKSPLIQLADLIGGAINRIINHTGERNYKDDMAEMIVARLGLRTDERNIDELDASAIFYL